MSYLGFFEGVTLSSVFIRGDASKAPVLDDHCD